MKVRFYRGPLDGKVKQVRDGEHIVMHAEYINNVRFHETLGTSPIDTVNVEQHVYYRTNHTHPDGSVYFEWSKPKGTKWNNNPKLRAKKFPKKLSAKAWTNTGYTMNLALTDVDVDTMKLLTGQP